MVDLEGGVVDPVLAPEQDFEIAADGVAVAGRFNRRVHALVEDLQRPTT